MSWSLRVSNGDLVLQGGKLGTVSSENKLLQDLRHNLLEKMGTDPLYPSYGSLIDGGRMPNGRVVDSPIGETNFGHIALQIEADIRRIALDYQRRQVDRAKRDRLRYNKVTLSQGEILIGVKDIRFEQRQDALLVHILIETGAGLDRNLILNLPAILSI